MTISSLQPVNNYTGNGSSTNFDFDFLIEAQEELVVTHLDKNGFPTILNFGIDYSINEIGNENGSYIVFPLETSNYGILSNEEKISLSLNLPIKQESEFENSSGLNLVILEKTFDYIVRVLQILNRKIERSIKTQEGSGIEPEALFDNLVSCANFAQQNAQIAEEKATLATEEAAFASENAKLASDKVIEANTIVENAQSSFIQLKESGIAQLSDVINDGFSSLSSAGNALRNNQITNAILEMPNRIKLEFSQGELILRKNSVVTVPNGYETDGITLHFNYKLVENDVVIKHSEIENNLFVCMNSDGIIYLTSGSNCKSGSIAPTSTSNRQFWYDTSRNVLNNYASNTDTPDSSFLSFPFAILNCTSENTFEVVQIFNGIGYIGSTIWVDKDIKYLRPNGRNIDGSLKNIEDEVTKCLVETNDSLVGTFNVSVGSDRITFDVPKLCIYDEENNFNSYSDIKNHIDRIVISKCTIDSENKITSLLQPRTINILKTDDKGKIINWCMPDYSAGIDVSSSAHTGSGVGFTPSTYGLLYIMGRNNNGNSFMYIYNKNSEQITQLQVNNSGSIYAVGSSNAFPVSPEYSYRVWQFVDNASVVFFPMKGVN